MTNLILAHLQSAVSLVVLAIVFITGIVRGFSGFGSGMIIGPVTAALFTPKFALAFISVVDSLPTLALVWNARKDVVWRQVLPVAIGYALLVPVGIFVLKSADPTAMRWFICLSIFIAVALLWSGWKYRGPRGKPVSLGIGATGGFMGASAALPGPAILLYWMSGNDRTAIIRANMIWYLFISDMIVIAGYWLSDVLTIDAVALGIVAMPLYFAGIIIGTRFFVGASEKTYRNVAFVMILVAAVSALPLLDPLLR